MPAPSVSPAACAELRRAAKRGEALTELADRYRLPYPVVTRHVRGACTHEIAEPPAPME